MTDTLAKKAKSLAIEFAKRLRDELGIDQAFLFGSLVYRDGARFSEKASDVDLAVIAPAGIATSVALSALARQIVPIKIDFELKLAGLLSRSTAAPICSLMLLTAREVGADIHKDGAEGFFGANEFENLLTGSRTVGLPGVGKNPITHRLVRQCLRFWQKKRHSFLGVAGNGQGGLLEFDGETLLPKDVLRHAAMAGALRAASDVPGAEFDTQEGLSELLHFVTTNAKDHDRYESLRTWMMNRLSTSKVFLNADDQLLCAEVISELAVIAEDARARAAAARPPRIESTVIFVDRVNEAFPGKRGIYWSSGPSDVEQRLNRLLGGKLQFGNATPIWMFRGGISVPIRRFKPLGDDTYLFDHLEVKVRRMAFAHSESYYRNFVYIEGDALPPIGINEFAANSAAEAVREGRTYYEEYGLTDDGLVISREEFDDGGAERDGKIIDTVGRTDIRCRYLTPFNFLLCAQMAPINNTRWDKRARELLDRMLAGENLIETVADDADQLPRRDDD